MDVTFLLSPKSLEAQAEWRALRDARDDVAEIYGTPVVGGTRRVLLFAGEDDPRVVIPREDPSQRLLLSSGEDVSDTNLAYAIAAAISAICAALAFWMRRRQRAS